MWYLVLVLFDPVKSAEPPIKVLESLTSELNVDSEDFLLAKLFISLTAFLFSILNELEKLFFKDLLISLFFLH